MVNVSVLKRLKQNSTSSFPKQGRRKQRLLNRKKISKDSQAIAKENKTENQCDKSGDKENMITYSNNEQPKHIQMKIIKSSEQFSNYKNEEIQTATEVRPHTPLYNTENVSTEEIKVDQNTVTMSECLDLHEPVNFECSVCNRQYSSAYCLQRHERTHRDEKPFRCSICGKSYNIRYALFDHRLKAHTEGKVCTCPVCNKSFANKKSLVHHMKGHSETPNYKCLHCSQTFLSRHMIRYHMQKTHNEGLALGRNHVELTNKSIIVQNQQETQKKNDQKWVCDNCGYCSKTFGNLKRHMHSHVGDRPLKCFICNKDFLRLKRLRIHSLSKHNIDIGDLVQVENVVFKSELKDRPYTFSVDSENDVDKDLNEIPNKKLGNLVEEICKSGPSQETLEMLNDEKDKQQTVSSGQTNRSVILSLFEMLQKRLDENNHKNVENKNEVIKGQINEIDEMHSQILECNSLLFARGSECTESLDAAIVQVNSSLDSNRSCITNTEDTVMVQVNIALDSNSPCKTNIVENTIQSKITESLNIVSYKETVKDQIQNKFSERKKKRKFSSTVIENDENTCSSEFLTPEIEPVIKKKKTHISIGNKSKHTAILTESNGDPNETIVQNKLRESDTMVKCAACGDVFKSRKSLTKHIYIVHTGYKPYQCDICGKYFSVKKNLKNHRKTHLKVK